MTNARPSLTKLVVASHNAGKVREMEELLAPFGVKLTSAAELGLPEPEETGATYEANAALKADAAASASGLPSLARRFRAERCGSGWRSGNLFRAVGWSTAGLLCGDGEGARGVGE